MNEQYTISKSQLKASNVLYLFRFARWLGLHIDKTWSLNQIVVLIWWRMKRDRHR
jgi:hypothetical protein